MPDRRDDPTAPDPKLPSEDAIGPGEDVSPQEPAAEMPIEPSPPDAEASPPGQPSAVQPIDAPPPPGDEAPQSPAPIAAPPISPSEPSRGSTESPLGRSEAPGARPAPIAPSAAPARSHEIPDSEPSHGLNEPPHDPASVQGGEAYEHEDEAGPSIAGRLLAALLLLLIGAGLGIWAAPRVAPRLPSGLAPVAEWLAPVQTDMEARLSAMQSKFTSELAALRQSVATQSQSDAEARVNEAVAAAESRSAEELNALRDQVAALGGGEDFRQRLNEIENSVQGQSAQLSELVEQIQGGAAASGAAEQVAEQVDVYRAELEGLRGEFASLSEQVAGLGARVEEVAASAERRVTEAEDRAAEAEARAAEGLTTAEKQASLAAIRSALASGEPYSEPLGRIAQQTAVPVALMNPANDGVATMLELREDFPEAAHQAIRASIVASSGGEGGLLARSRAFLEAQVASRSLSPQAGMDPDAVLSRMEEALRIGDLEAALSEAENLPGEAREAMSDWLGRADRRLEAVRAFESVAAEPAATN